MLLAPTLSSVTAVSPVCPKMSLGAQAKQPASGNSLAFEQPLAFEKSSAFEQPLSFEKRPAAEPLIASTGDKLTLLFRCLR